VLVGAAVGAAEPGVASAAGEGPPAGSCAPALAAVAPTAGAGLDAAGAGALVPAAAAGAVVEAASPTWTAAVVDTPASEPVVGVAEGAAAGPLPCAASTEAAACAALVGEPAASPAVSCALAAAALAGAPDWPAPVAEAPASAADAPAPDVTPAAPVGVAGAASEEAGVGVDDADPDGRAPVDDAVAALGEALPAAEEESAAALRGRSARVAWSWVLGG